MCLAVCTIYNDACAIQIIAKMGQPKNDAEGGPETGLPLGMALSSNMLIIDTQEPVVTTLNHICKCFFF